ncbi:hypothetical protein HanXRQr2_Chr15g0691491 [Helianthus annuus]|uniref:Uncharacterized protein n=1 Tax=Helianthus annuus TaxID=4232 RepID=A0A251S8G8_HELAN|nr:hypothetical protein HanXRQr2_Chr15g0691491 [Helianthus annuus]
MIYAWVYNTYRSRPRVLLKTIVGVKPIVFVGDIQLHHVPVKKRCHLQLHHVPLIKSGGQLCGHPRSNISHFKDSCEWCTSTTQHLLKRLKFKKIMMNC